MATRTALSFPFGSTGQFFTGNTNLSSSAVYIEYGAGYSVQVSTSANVSASSTQGTFKLLGSNDNINFVTINGSSAFMGSTGNLLINVSDAYYKYVKTNFLASAAPSSGFVMANLLYKAWGA